MEIIDFMLLKSIILDFVIGIVEVFLKIIDLGQELFYHLIFFFDKVFQCGFFLKFPLELVLWHYEKPLSLFQIFLELWKLLI